MHVDKELDGLGYFFVRANNSFSDDFFSIDSFSCHACKASVLDIFNNASLADGEESRSSIYRLGSSTPGSEL